MTGLAGRIDADVCYDLCVVGGGITGAGIAWRAAAAGRSVVLLEAEDFAAGTSSRSTKLIHGGLRYLALGELQLVRDGVRERQLVREIAPHLAEPRWMVLPARAWWERIKYRLGVTLYEQLGGVRGGDRHRVLSGEDLAAFEPTLRRRQGLTACVYREYLTDDARLVIAVLRGAEAFGATVCSRVRALNIRRDARRFIVETTAGALRTEHVINATGPWAETLPGAIKGRLALSKGVHIAVPLHTLAVTHLLMLPARDGRPVFVIPRGNVAYIGTTDAFVDGSAELWPSVPRHDVEYLLETARRHCDTSIAVESVVATWAGLRPLVQQPGRPSRDVSRRDEIWVDRKGVVTIGGGKLTGFIGMANRALARIGVEAAPLSPLPGGDLEDVDAAVATLATDQGIVPSAARRLVRLYGDQARTVLERGEVRWAVEEEAAQSLEDLVYRRMRLAHFEPVGLASRLPDLAAEMGAVAGWDQARCSREAASTASRLRADLTFD